MRTESKHASRRAEDPGGAEMSEREIDFNLEQSFPASDPPSWTLGIDHNVPIDTEDEKSPDSTNEI